jgi:hypothetical protein
MTVRAAGGVGEVILPVGVTGEARFAIGFGRAFAVTGMTARAIAVFFDAMQAK